MAVEAPRRIALRLCLASGVYSVPLSRIHQIAGYATLTGEPEDYFLGWLTLRGEAVPVFDLNRVVCEHPTPEHFGSRILIVDAPAGAPTPLVGLLAAGLTDTVASAGVGDVAALDLDAYLPMLSLLIPPLPAVAA
jgi:chemotaxis signal transduction protein